MISSLFYFPDLSRYSTWTHEIWALFPASHIQTQISTTKQWQFRSVSSKCLVKKHNGSKGGIFPGKAEFLKGWFSLPHCAPAVICSCYSRDHHLFHCGHHSCWHSYSSRVPAASYSSISTVLIGSKVDT